MKGSNNWLLLLKGITKGSSSEMRLLQYFDPYFQQTYFQHAKIEIRLSHLKILFMVYLLLWYIVQVLLLIYVCSYVVATYVYTFLSYLYFAQVTYIPM